MKIIEVAAIAAGLSLSLPNTAATQDRFDGWCDDLRNASSADLVKFLGRVDRDQKNGRCITWAIHKLGNERYEAAIPVMVKLLDFRRPLTDDEKIGFYLRIQVIPERLPAAEALEDIGNNAQDEVLHAIMADRVSATARENAIDVWMEIYKYERPRGVALLIQEEH